jgi:hypothetical protein
MIDPNYAHPEALVTTEWVATHLNEPNSRLVESNEDILLYGTPGSDDARLYLARSLCGTLL